MFESFGSINDFNLFNNLDSIEARVINFIKQNESPEANRIWKLLKYSDIKALFKDNLTSKEKEDLIYTDEDQAGKRVFNFNLIEDAFQETCSIIKVYTYSVVPSNHLLSTVNIAIDVLSHNKLSNVYNDDGDTLDGGRPVEENVNYKNRNMVLMGSLLKILNGAQIEGVGQLQFNKEVRNSESRAEMRLSNNTSFYGFRLIFSCEMGGVGVPYYG